MLVRNSAEMGKLQMYIFEGSFNFAVYHCNWAMIAHCSFLSSDVSSWIPNYVIMLLKANKQFSKSH